MKYLGLSGSNPASIVDKFPEERKPRYVPPEVDFWKVYDTAEGQDKVMLAVVLYTAARRGEVRPALDDLNRKPAQVLEFKGKKSRRASGDE